MMTGRRKPIMVCRVEYETKDRTNWKANVLAYGMQDAIDYLIKKVPTWDRYISTQIIGNVDAIEDSMFQDYFVANETTVVETVVSAPPSSDMEERIPCCPWCDKEFKSKGTLATHIKKFHITTDE